MQKFRLPVLFLAVMLAFFAIFRAPTAIAAGSIVDVAAEDGRFTTLIAAAQQAGIATMLDQNGPFTVFAPTDAAFAMLPEGLLESLDNTTLRQILLYHLIQGKVMAEDVVGLDSARTALGQMIDIEVVDGAVILNGEAQVIITDIEASNGVIHVIDAVLIPDLSAWTPAPPASEDGPWMGGDDDAAMDDDGDYVVVYYLSNPDEILGVFPILDFDAEWLYNDMLWMKEGIDMMLGALDGASRGDRAACGHFLHGYEMVFDSGAWYENVPAEWAEADARFYTALIWTLDRTRPAAISCDEAGRVDPFNYGLAMQSLHQAQNVLNPAIAIAEALLGVGVSE
jgi:hypothetical protein